jgi:cytochrome c-L
VVRLKATDWTTAQFIATAGAACIVAAAIAQEKKTVIPKEEPIVFRDVLTKQPIEFTKLPSQEITAAVKEFHRTAKNPYSGDQQARSKGKELYAQYCQPCHMPDGSGGMGPSLIDDQWSHPDLAGDKGMFEIIYGGGAGAMQSFGDRISQDDILKTMAYIETLREKK